jgi:hypothetical protein
MYGIVGYRPNIALSSPSIYTGSVTVSRISGIPIA